MSRPNGTIPLTGTIYTTDDADTFATHIDSCGKGGYRSVSTLSERDEITQERRKIGMLVYVQENNKLYILKDSILNDSWVEFSAGGSTISNVIVSPIEPIQPNVNTVWLNPIDNTLKYRDPSNIMWLDLIGNIIIDGGLI